MGYIDTLNEAQKAAVLNTEGPSLVIAGAGSGKTRVLTYRIAYLLEKGVDPSSILALTFTNKAAAEMKERIGATVGFHESKKIWMGTFHSIFSKILRFESESLGYSSNFTIYDTSDNRNLIKKIVKDLKLDDKVYKPGDVAARISFAKNNLITPKAYGANTQLLEADKKNQKPEFHRIFVQHAMRCKKSDAMDFDDLLLNTNILFRDLPDLLLKYQQRFKYILVDEYQDTNYAQYLIVKKLAEGKNNVCVVGDDAQSIYSFRGARIENILNFKTDYPGYQMFKLEQNYRSTQTIVKAANSIISKNKGQIKKIVFSENDQGEKIKVYRAHSDQDESHFVANEIHERSLTERLNYLDFAILYRTNAQSRAFEEALRKRNIPYKVYGSISFYQRKEIKDILAYFRLTINPNDDEAFKRVVNYPGRGIGLTTMDKIENWATRYNLSIWETLSTTKPSDLNINQGTVKKIVSFTGLIKAYHEKFENSDAYELAMYIAQSSGILGELKSESTPEGISRFENLEELLNGIKEFVENHDEADGPATLDHYMENVSLLTDADNEKGEDKNRVSLMTVHSAKGLEFDQVYVAGLEENLFPSNMSIMSEKDIEEERRLFYVALTRAKKKATLSFALTRYKWGEITRCKASRFIQEIDQIYLDLPDSFTDQEHETERQRNEKKFITSHISGGIKSGQNQYKPQLNRRLTKVEKTITKTAPSISESDSSKLIPGAQVQHERFGKGKILNKEGVFPNQKITVFFQGAGQKQLLLKFAKLEVIG